MTTTFISPPVGHREPCRVSVRKGEPVATYTDGYAPPWSARCACRGFMAEGIDWRDVLHLAVGHVAHA